MRPEGLSNAGIGLLTLTQVLSIPLILLSIYMLWRVARQPEIPLRAGGHGHRAADSVGDRASAEPNLNRTTAKGRAARSTSSGAAFFCTAPDPRPAPGG